MVIEWLLKPVEDLAAFFYRSFRNQDDETKLELIFRSILKKMPKKLTYKKWAFDIVTPKQKGVRYIHYKTKSTNLRYTLIRMVSIQQMGDRITVTLYSENFAYYELSTEYTKIAEYLQKNKINAVNSRSSNIIK